MSVAIALLTDFGVEDPYAGVLKAVILSRCPCANIVDLCHGIRPQDVRQAAFALRSSAPYFPDRTLFVCVVDPGVGSSRAVLWARSRRHAFLAPDNGLLSWLGRDERLLEIRRVTNRALFLPAVSRTFHGRDVFAPVAAALAGGLAPSRLGPRTRGLLRLRPPRRGAVLFLDRFGNAVTNLRPTDLKGARSLEASGTSFPLRTHYGAVRRGLPLALVGSSGFIELSVREGRTGLKAGDPVYAHRTDG